MMWVTSVKVMEIRGKVRYSRYTAVGTPQGSAITNGFKRCTPDGALRFQDLTVL